jgi:hypothetical protein
MVTKNKIKLLRVLYSGVLFILFAFVSVSAIAQKKLKEKFKQARDEGGNYVIMASGEKKDIKSVKFPTARKQGNIEFADGTSSKFWTRGIQAVQTDYGFQKVIDYRHPDFGMTFGRATRLAKGVFNVYHMTVHYQVKINEYVSGDRYFFDKPNELGIVQLVNEVGMFNYVDSLTSKSKAAREVVDLIQRNIGKWQTRWSSEEKLVEALELYNKDAAEGRLETK